MKMTFHITSYILLSLSGLYAIAFLIDVATTPPTKPADIAVAETYLEENKLPTPPLTFYHDGCTAWPDFLLWHDFTTACFAHDVAYWAGGTLEQKTAADVALREEVTHTGPLGPAFGLIMFVGVHYFGNNWVSEMLGSEWGYGWSP